MLDKGIMFYVETSDSFDKIIIYNSKQQSYVEFDGKSKKAIPFSFSVEEIEHLTSSSNQELCKVFDHNPLLAADLNKVGISLETVSTQEVKNAYGMIQFSNAIIKHNQNLVKQITGSFFCS